jgi:hypothetical protein
MSITHWVAKTEFWNVIVKSFGLGILQPREYPYR